RLRRSSVRGAYRGKGPFVRKHTKTSPGTHRRRSSFREPTWAVRKNGFDRNIVDIRRLRHPSAPMPVVDQRWEEHPTTRQSFHASTTPYEEQTKASKRWKGQAPHLSPPSASRQRSRRSRWGPISDQL